MILRDWSVVHIYGVVQMGRSTYSRLEYTTDAKFALCELQADLTLRH